MNVRRDAPAKTWPCSKCGSEMNIIFSFETLGREVICPICTTKHVIVGEDSDDGFSFWVEAT